MNHILSIARKELRGYFNSAVALIFLATFLGVVLFTVFWVEKFFARNLADVRPMFDWLPLLLIFLVAALSMRLWSEEYKVGTIEVLLTLPVERHKLVLGKFLGGMALVALALLLTLGLPITVAKMGDLDWGPVIGGYLAALLLAGAYLSIGMCVSAATDNQIVALVLTVLLCGLFYLPGAESVSGLVSMKHAELLRALGTGSRFASIARGVLDLRDLAYYGTLIAVFLTINTVLLKARGWSGGPRAHTTRWNALAAVGLVVANAIALNVWLSPVGRVRIDLTEHGEYSLSATTKDLLHSLDEPLTIRAYFSEKTHPKLAPLVPQLIDLLDEYKVAGGSKVRVEVVDPSKSDEIEKEAAEQFDIKPVPFRFADRHEAAVVNAYFHILIQYGDQYQVLSFDDLIEVKQVDLGQLEVRLRNPEYDLTKTIKKVAYGFQSLDALFASLPGKAELTAYITPSTLPDNLKDAPDKLAKVTAAMAKDAGGKLEYKMVEPKTEADQRELAEKFGFQPFQVSPLEPKVFYFHILLKVGERYVRVALPSEVTEASLKTGITDALKRVAPGFIKHVALWTPPAPPPMPDPNGMGQPPQQQQPPESFRMLEQTLAETYEVSPAALSTGRVDDSIEVLILAGPANLGEKEQRAIDQFLMRGGALIVLDGRYRLDLSAQSLAVEQVTTGLEPMLAKWGVTVEPKMVLDSQNDSFPIPVNRDLGGMTVREMRQLPYPFFVRIDKAGMSEGSAVTGELNAAIFHFASPVVVAKPEPTKPDAKSGEATPPRKIDVLMKSSADAWLQLAPDVQPDFRIHPESGFGKPKDVPAADKGPHPLAVALTGSFASSLAPAKPAEGKPGEAAERLLDRSPPDARLVVIGSSAFVSDEVVQLSRSAGSDNVLNNLQFVHNLVDWAVSDTDLLAIRSRGNYTRTLDVPDDKRGRWEGINYGIVILGLGLVIGANLMRRRRLVAMPLDPPRGDGSSGGGAKTSAEDA